MIVEENGKRYHIDEKTGLVSEASATDTEDEIVDLSGEFRIGDRVQVEDELGNIISMTASIYGPAFGVRFDSGDIDEFPEGALKRSAVETPDYLTPIHEVTERFATYNELPALTNDELTEKETEARWLNLRAKSLVTDAKLALTDQNDLGRIVLVTGDDLLTIKELREQSEETKQYTSKFNRYKISEEIYDGAVMGAKGDASWLGDAIEGMEVVETTDADLAARATEIVASFSKGQLEDDSFMKLAASFQREYLQMTDEQAKKFESMLTQARKERLKEIPETKTASTDDDIADFDASAIFL